MTDPDQVTAEKLRAYQPHAGLPRATVAQCPPCNGHCRQGRDCPGPDTVPTDYGSGYGDLAQPKPPRVVPCSTLARWAMDARDGNPRSAVAIVIGVIALALLGAGASVVWWMSKS